MMLVKHWLQLDRKQNKSDVKNPKNKNQVSSGNGGYLIFYAFYFAVSKN